MTISPVSAAEMHERKSRFAESAENEAIAVLQLLVVLCLIFLGHWALKLFPRTPPAVFARILRRMAGFLSIVLGLSVLFRGEFGLAFVAGAFGAWLLGLWRPGWRRSGFWGGASQRKGVSFVRSAMIEMELDHATGAMGGTVLVGDYEGRPLSALSQSECMALYRHCQADDSDGAQLIEAYFDRRFAGWRQARQAESDAWTSRHSARDAAMSEDEAYEVLGLRKGAGTSDITRAHRALMKKFHPDQGGTTDLAARVNEAKDVLMRRHL